MPVRTGGSFVADPKSGEVGAAPDHKPMKEVERPFKGERVGAEKGAPKAEPPATPPADANEAPPADEQPAAKRGK